MSKPITKKVTLSSLTISVADWGKESKPPLLLIHGLASTHHMFDLIAPKLAEDFHVYAFDQRGHGDSDKPTSGYDFEQIACDIDELLQQLGLEHPIPIVGHSWGGYTALYYAATRPNKVKKAVLLDGGTLRFRDLYPEWDEANIAMSPPEFKDKSIEDIKQMIRDGWLGEAWRPELEPLALSIFDTTNPKDVKARLTRENHMQIAKAIWAFEPTDYYAKVQCPILVIYAQSSNPDDYARQQKQASTAQAHLSDAEIVWMPDTIHDIPWHKPAELISILDAFLR